MANRKANRYVDLVISEAEPSMLNRLRRQYRICTLSQSRGQHYINLRVPEVVQDKIISAYEEGKQVRIFA